MWHCDVQPVRLSVARICATPCVVVVVVYLTRGGGDSFSIWTEQVGRQLSGEHQYTSCSAACSSTSETYMKSPFKCTQIIVHIERVKSDLSVVLRLVGTILERTKGCNCTLLLCHISTPEHFIPQILFPTFISRSL